MDRFLLVFEQPVVQCIGLVLLHFLWQGVVVAFCLACLLRLLRQRSANARYVASGAALAAIILLPVITFMVVDAPQRTEGIAGVEIASLSLILPEQQDAPQTAELAPTPDSFEWVEPADIPFESPAMHADEDAPGPDEALSPALFQGTDWEQLFTAILPWVVSFWLLGVLLLSIRLTGSWLRIVRLKWFGTRRLSEPLQSVAKRLSEQLGVRRTIAVLESNLAIVPCLIGFLRPTILLPTSALTGLSPEQLEMILAHELAHVRRHDYIITVIQAVVEVLLFYHPAVWWISRRLHAERENSCDDMVVSMVKSPQLYAQTLADMAGLVLKHQQLTAAASGADLKGRIRRILGVDPARSARPVSWWPGALLLVLFVAMALVVSSPTTSPYAQAEDADIAVGDEGGTESDGLVGESKSADAGASDSLQPLRFDDFDGELALDWQVIRPDPTHVSLEKNPGKLTITSQFGGLHSDEGGKIPGPRGNNLYTIAVPTEADDFVVTTCLEDFHPTARFQQAGPIIYDDDSNYFKALIGIGYGDVLIGSSWESRSDFWGMDIQARDMEWDRTWLRITKRGNAYEAAYSFDGEEYRVINEHVWGDGTPQRIGLAVMNEDGSSVPIDAVFDFFEVRALTPGERNDPAFHERQKFRGVWETVPLSANEASPASIRFTRFTFDGSGATITERQNSLFSEFFVHPDRDPKQFSLSRAGRGVVNSAYRFDGEHLVVCMNTRPDVPAPTEFDSGDGRVLLRLQRTPEVVVKAIERYRFWGMKRFQMLDANRDDSVTREEFLLDFPSPEATRQGTELFAIVDQDDDGTISLDEFKNWPRETLVYRFDLDADGGLSEREFMLGDVPTASLTRARKVFRLTDQDSDGLVSTKEFFSRPSEAWYAKLDANEDEGVSYTEYALLNEALVRKNRCRAVFDEIDTDSNGSLSRDEYLSKGPRFTFLKVEALGNGDGKMSLDEFISLKRSENVEDVKAEFEEKDLDSDGALTVDEFAPPAPEKAEDEAEGPKE